MRKKIVSILIFIILILTANKVFATENPIIISGDSEVVVGNEVILTVKISGEDLVGVLSGKIEKNNNVTILSVSGKNDWSVTFNSETGEFNALKAAGSKNEDLMEIKIKAENSGTGKITLSNLKVTTTSYETKDLDNITKNIQVSNNSSENTEKPQNNTTTDEGKKDDKTTRQETDSNKKNTENDGNQKILNIDTKSTNVKNTDNTTSTKILAKTGVKGGIFIVALLIVIVAVYTGIKYNKFKNI